MSDLISRKTALEALADYIHMIDKTMGKGTLTEDDCMEAAKSVLGEDELPAVQPEPHWIPCGERLPEEKQSVLVTDGSVIWVCDIISTDEGYKWEDSHGYWLDLDEWTAWMPLPEPYMKEGDQ